MRKTNNNNKINKNMASNEYEKLRLEQEKIKSRLYIVEAELAHLKSEDSNLVFKDKQTVNICENCGSRLTKYRSEIKRFFADPEPYRHGISEEAEESEIKTRLFFVAFICTNCRTIEELSLVDSHINIERVTNNFTRNKE